jgi:RIO kinase 1
MGKEKFKVLEGVFDEFTLSVLETLKRKKYFDELSRPIKTGKEGDVYLAMKGQGEDRERRAIKMFRVTSANFKKISSYIQRDYRFKTIKGNLRKVIMMWAQKEYRNLLLCHKAQMNVPFPYKQMYNVIVMEYVDGCMLKDAHLEDPESFFRQLIEQLWIMKHHVKMVHGDLSEFNIMVSNQMPVIIDLGQAMTFKNEDEFLLYEDLFLRDLKVVSTFFQKKYGLSYTVEDMVSLLSS